MTAKEPDLKIDFFPLSEQNIYLTDTLGYAT
jgi:hypothetical protein